MVEVEVDLAPHNPYGLLLRSPLVAAAGALGYGLEFQRLIGLGRPGANHGLGALITRTTTLQPRRATPLPQLVETPAGLVYSGWRHNPGLPYVLRRCVPAWVEWDLPVILSIAGDDGSECAALAASLEGVEGIAGVEVSLPVMGITAVGQVTTVVAAVRRATLLPLLVKLPLFASDLPALAKAATAAGADTLTLAGCAPAIAVDPLDGRQVEGWLCGPAQRPLALAAVAALAATATLPIIGGGGIAGHADARAFLAAGASAIALGSALIADPRTGAFIVAGR